MTMSLAVHQSGDVIAAFDETEHSVGSSKFSSILHSIDLPQDSRSVISKGRIAPTDMNDIIADGVKRIASVSNASISTFSAS